MHRAGQMVVEPHAPEAGPLGRGGAGQGVVDADTERVEEQVDLHAASMAEPAGGPISRAQRVVAPHGLTVGASSDCHVGRYVRGSAGVSPL